MIEPSNEITITPFTSPSGASQKTISSGTITPSTGPPEALRKIGKWSFKSGNWEIGKLGNREMEFKIGKWNGERRSRINHHRFIERSWMSPEMRKELTMALGFMYRTGEYNIPVEYFKGLLIGYQRKYLSIGMNLDVHLKKCFISI